MSRVKTGPIRHRRHKQVLKSVKGHRLSRSRHYKVAHEESLHAGQYAFAGRKNRKRDFRRLWIQRITAGLSQIDNGPSYSVFANILKSNQVTINRKMLAMLALHDQEGFNAIVSKVYGN
jgi:large subunit ribosomal protein L20